MEDVAYRPQVPKDTQNILIRSGAGPAGPHVKTLTEPVSSCFNKVHWVTDWFWVWFGWNNDPWPVLLYSPVALYVLSAGNGAPGHLPLSWPDDWPPVFSELEFRTGDKHPPLLLTCTITVCHMQLVALKYTSTHGAVSALRALRRVTVRRKNWRRGINKDKKE